MPLAQICNADGYFYGFENCERGGSKEGGREAGWGGFSCSLFCKVGRCWQVMQEDACLTFRGSLLEPTRDILLPEAESGVAFSSHCQSRWKAARKPGFRKVTSGMMAQGILGVVPQRSNFLSSPNPCQVIFKARKVPLPWFF